MAGEMPRTQDCENIDNVFSFFFLGFVEVYDLKTKTWTRGHKNYPEDTWEHACVALHIPSIRKDEIESE